MKHKRQKNVKRMVKFYAHNFGITPPYNVLVDGTFAKHALLNKINIQEQLPKYLEGEVKLHTTSCGLFECEQMGPLFYGPLKVLRQYKELKCSHQPINPVECLFKQLKKGRPNNAQALAGTGFKKRRMNFFIATHDPMLSQKARKLAAVPLLFIANNAICLEKPTEKSKAKAKKLLNEKLLPTHELKKLKEGDEEIEEEKQKKKKKIKGPNPLSCKKKKKRAALHGVQQSEISEGAKKRARRRKKGKKEVDNIADDEKQRLINLVLQEAWGANR